MSTTPFCAQCKHCERVFFTMALWQDHYAWHSNIQDQPHRPAGVSHEPSLKKPGQSHFNSKTEAIDTVDGLVSRLRIHNSHEDKQKGQQRINDVRIGKKFSQPSPKEDASNVSLTHDQIEQSLKRIIDDFPPYEGDGRERVRNGPPLKCPGCDYLFNSLAQLDEHQLSKYCKGGQIIVHIMVVDSSSPGNYRIEQEKVPFRSKLALFKCTKCDMVLGTSPSETRRHMKSHRKNPVPCVHCEKAFDSQYELKEHYDWHGNMHLRHHIDAKQNSTSSNKAFTGYNFSGENASQIKQEKPHIRNPWARKDRASQRDGDIIAISFIGGEDLERQYAPDGVLRVPANDAYSMMANINLSNLSEAIGLINSSTRPRKSKSNVVQHAQQTEHENDHRIRRMTAWELSYINTPPGWILSRDDSKWVDFYPLETQIMNEGNKVREQDILDDIISYAEMHPVDDFGGLVNILGSFPNQVSVGELKTEQLRRWLRKEKMVGLGDNKAEHPPPGLKILGYSSQNELLARDSSGRSRYLSGRDLCEILSTAHCEPSGDLATIRLALGTQGQIALARGNIFIAEGKYLQLLRSVKTFKGDPQVEFLGYMHLAMNIYKANQMIKQAAGMLIQALNLSQRLYGMDNINNFTIIGNLARHYDKLNRREEAAALLRRSLRGRLNCCEQEAALLDKQDLAKIYVDLGDNPRAVQLFEEAYEGFQQVLGPEHRTTLLAINNFAGVACSAGSLQRGRSLLLSVVPLLQKSLGPDDDVSWSSICNFLNYAENGRIPDTIVPVIQVYLMQSSPASLKVLKCLAEFYGRNGLVRKAMEAYKRLSGRIKMLNSTSDRGVLDALYGEAYALEKLGEYNEAVKQYRQLRSIATNYYPAELQRWKGICDLALKDLSQRQAIVSCERLDWGSNIPAKCSARDCNNQCLQFCSGCKMVRFCSAVCEAQDTYHKAICLPSVTISESVSIYTQNDGSQSEKDSIASRLKRGLPLPRLPTCVSAKIVFIDPLNFVTIRFSKGLSNILTFRPVGEADIRFMIFGASPFKWSTPKDVAMWSLEPIADCYIVVTPGEKMFKNLIEQREKSTGVKLPDMGVPDKELVEYAQSAAPRSSQYIPAFEVMEWAL